MTAQIRKGSVLKLLQKGHTNCWKLELKYKVVDKKYPNNHTYDLQLTKEFCTSGSAFMQDYKQWVAYNSINGIENHNGVKFRKNPFLFDLSKYYTASDPKNPFNHIDYFYYRPDPYSLRIIPKSYSQLLDIINSDDTDYNICSGNLYDYRRFRFAEPSCIPVRSSLLVLHVEPIGSQFPILLNPTGLKKYMFHMEVQYGLDIYSFGRAPNSDEEDRTSKYARLFKSRLFKRKSDSNVELNIENGLLQTAYNYHSFELRETLDGFTSYLVSDNINESYESDKHGFTTLVSDFAEGHSYNPLKGFRSPMNYGFGDNKTTDNSANCITFARYVCQTLLGGSMATSASEVEMRRLSEQVIANSDGGKIKIGEALGWVGRKPQIS